MQSAWNFQTNDFLEGSGLSGRVNGEDLYRYLYLVDTPYKIIRTTRRLQIMQHATRTTQH
jgi:hypothetical protein